MLAVARTVNALRCFPEGFLFGSATSSFQAEGAWNASDKNESIWDVYCRENSEVACANVADDFYHRFKDDIALMVQDGHSSFRFSISWPRVMSWDSSTKRMVPNPKGIGYYHSLINDLTNNNIEPVLTLYHWDMPVELQTELDEVGWLDPSMIEHFAQCADLMYLEFGDKVKYWATFNEPLLFVGVDTRLVEHHLVYPENRMPTRPTTMYCLLTVSLSNASVS